MITLGQRETDNIIQTPFSIEWGHLKETGLAKRDCNWLYYLIDTIFNDHIKRRLM